MRLAHGVHRQKSEFVEDIGLPGCLSPGFRPKFIRRRMALQR